MTDLARAAAMLDVRRYPEATALLAQLVAAGPENDRAWCLLARAHLGTGRFAEALAAANRAVALNPADEWPHRLASSALVHLGKTADALAAAEQACQLAPMFWQTHVCLAQAALAAHQQDVAHAAASQARSLAPDEPDVHFLCGKVALSAGALVAARAHQERALALDPAHSGAMNELGRIRLRRHDTAGAIRHFINAARLSPTERIYTRNIDVVILRTVSRAIYLFTLVALVLLWIPALALVPRVPFLIGLGGVCVLAVSCLTWMLLRLPREARLLVRRMVRTRQVSGAVALAAGGFGFAFCLVALAPSGDLTRFFPLAVLVMVVARLAAFASLRAAARR